MLRLLETSNFWLADGTFKVTPKRFYQLYSIHVSLSGIAPACIYAFLPNKSEKIYHRFLEALIVDLKKTYWILSKTLFKCFKKFFPSPSKKKYRLLNEKVQNIMHVYKEKTDLHFFRAMANLS